MPSIFFQQEIAGVVSARTRFLLAFDNHTLPNQNQILICSMLLFSCVCLLVIVFFLVGKSSRLLSSCRHRIPSELTILSVYLFFFQHICSVHFRSLYAGVFIHAWKDRDSHQQENRRERHRCRNVSFSNLIIITHQVYIKEII